MSDTMVNKVAESGLVEIDLAEFYPKEPVVVFDLKNYLFRELVLKEKDFREAMKQHDFSVYRGKPVAVTCTADAIIPMWAYMLVTVYLQPFAGEIAVGSAGELQQTLMLRNINTIVPADYKGKRVVVKGCGDIAIGAAAYLEITKLLRPVAKSIMYGEPCSTVPIYKEKTTVGQ